MPEPIKAKLQQAKQFVEQHQTLVACTTTAVVTAFVVRELDIRVARGFAYNAGLHAGVLEMRARILQEFIESKGLKYEFFTEYLPTINM